MTATSSLRRASSSSAARRRMVARSAGGVADQPAWDRSALPTTSSTSSNEVSSRELTGGGADVTHTASPSRTPSSAGSASVVLENSDRKRVVLGKRVS